MSLPVDVPIPTSTSKSNEMEHEEIIEFLGEDEKEVIELPKPAKLPDDKDKKSDEEIEVEIEEQPDELAEIEEELEPPTEEQLELIAPVRRREILAKYPTLFKEFPYLEKAYYREQQFTEVFPTIPDAKEAAEKAQTLDKFEIDIIRNGNTENILRAVKEENPDSFLKLVDEYLPTLARVDNQAYLHVLGNVAKHTIVAMVQEARKSNNEALQSAAQILNQFIFGSSDFIPPTNLAKMQTDDGKKDEVEQRKQAFVQQQFGTTLGDLNTRVNNTLKNTIDANIDPKKSMTDFVRKHASQEALEELGKLIAQDNRFKALTDKLWERCIEDNFSKLSTDRIRSAFLSKAKTLLPSVIKKARNEALKGMGKKVNETDEELTPNKGPVTLGRPRSQQSGGKVKEAKDIPKGMNTLEFLSQD